MLYTFEFLVILITILVISFCLWAFMWHDEVKCTIAQRELLKNINSLEPIKFSGNEAEAEVIQFDSLKQQTSELSQQKQKKYSTAARLH